MERVSADALRQMSDTSQIGIQRINLMEADLEQAKRQRLAEYKAKQQELEALEQDLRYRNFVETLILKCELAALGLTNNDRAEVFEIHFNRDTIGDLWHNRASEFNASDPDRLIGAGKRVWDYLVDQKLNPSLVQHPYKDDPLDTGCRIQIIW